MTPFAVAIGQVSDREQVIGLEEAETIGGIKPDAGLDLLGHIAQSSGGEAVLADTINDPTTDQLPTPNFQRTAQGTGRTAHGP